MRGQWPSDAGSALLMVQAIVLVLSSLAVLLSGAALNSVRSAANARASLDARWTASGASEAAAALIESGLADEGRLEPYQQILPWAGGTVSISIRESRNCFNLNALHDGSGEGLVSEDQVDALKRLMMASGIAEDDAQRATHSLADWIDADDSSRPDGAESLSYDNKSPPYRAANGALTSVAELYDIEGFAPALLAKISGVICVELPGQASALNVNTLTAEDWPLLHALLPDAFDDMAAFLRWQDGHGAGNTWTSVEAFRRAAGTSAGLAAPDGGIVRFATRPVRAESTLAWSGEAGPVMTVRYVITDAGRAEAGSPVEIGTRP